MGPGSHILLEWAAMQLVEIALWECGRWAYKSMRNGSNGDSVQSPERSDPSSIEVQASRRPPLHSVQEAVILSSTPGRARIRVAGLRGDPAAAATLARRVEELPGVSSVSASALTGNLLVKFDELVTAEAICSAIDTSPRQRSRSAPQSRSHQWS